MRAGLHIKWGLDMGNLTVKTIQSIIKAGRPGRYSDGQRLYLMEPQSGEPYWCQHRQKWLKSRGK